MFPINYIIYNKLYISISICLCFICFLIPIYFIIENRNLGPEAGVYIYS